MKLWALYVFCFLFGLNVRNRKYRKQGEKNPISSSLANILVIPSYWQPWALPLPKHIVCHGHYIAPWFFIRQHQRLHTPTNARRQKGVLINANLLTANLLSASTATASKGLFAPPRPNEMDNYGKCHCNKKGFTDTVKQHSFLKSCYSQTSDF